MRGGPQRTRTAFQAPSHIERVSKTQQTARLVGLEPFSSWTLEAGDGAVEKEIVPLDGGADGGRDNGTAELHLMFSRRKLKGGDISRDHGHFSRIPLRRPGHDPEK